MVAAVGSLMARKRHSAITVATTLPGCRYPALWMGKCSWLQLKSDSALTWHPMHTVQMHREYTRRAKVCLHSNLFQARM